MPTFAELTPEAYARFSAYTWLVRTWQSALEEAMQRMTP
jgi:hypothetical protein